jgi:ribosomal protein S18 acetylase RimI-like enzyme
MNGEYMKRKKITLSIIIAFEIIIIITVLILVKTNIKNDKAPVDTTATEQTSSEVSKENETTYEMEKLAVLPKYRHLGYGKALIDFTKEYVKSQNGEIVTIGIIDENTTLKQWYSAYGFTEKGTKTFSHLPFIVCFMEIKV